MDTVTVEDVRAADPVTRLLEDSWESRSSRASRRELIVEAVAAVSFLALAVPWALPTLTNGSLELGLVLLLVGMYAVVSRTIKFPIGAGYVVPSYLVLVPMLVLLPPNVVPLLVAIGLTVGNVGRLIAGRATPDELLFSVPDAWHAFGPAVVLSLAPDKHGAALAVLYVAAFLAGCLVDLIASTLRESLALAVAPRLQGRVIANVWLVDASIAPLGLLVAYAAEGHPGRLMLLVPVMGLLAMVDRDRNARIADARNRLSVVARERTRLQSAVQRLGDAFAAKLDLRALTDVVLHGSIDALDAEAGRLVMAAPSSFSATEMFGAVEHEEMLAEVSKGAQSDQRPRQLEAGGVWALAIPFVFSGGGGALAVARRERAFRDDEQALVLGLVERAQSAAAEILAHEALREQALTDPLTRLGNRRKLSEDLIAKLHNASTDHPLALLMFDLDGFKSYNDTFGHVAGDALLTRLGRKLAATVAPDGTAYRLGGDEFCVLLPAQPDELQETVVSAAAALEEHGETFTVSASCGGVLLPHEATTPEYALQLADERMYARKQGRPSEAAEQAHNVLVHIMRARQPDLGEHSTGVARLAVAVGRRLAMTVEEIDAIGRAAALHDIGKMGIPDAILSKPGPLDDAEWDFIRQHTLLGERILSGAPALRPVAQIVRASHERWDGRGYPDGLRGEDIPLAARIVAVCDAYEAITTDRVYRAARSHEIACAELRREAGHQFDPIVVEAFLAELNRPTLRPAPSAGVDQRKELVGEVVGPLRELIRRRRRSPSVAALAAVQLERDDGDELAERRRRFSAIS